MLKGCRYMMRPIALIMALLFAALGWQSWRLNNASHTIESQGKELNSKKQALTHKNSQLIALNILRQTSSHAQTQLYALAEKITPFCVTGSGGLRN